MTAVPLPMRGRPWGARWSKRVFYPLAGMLMLFGLWWLGGYWLQHDRSISSFDGFAPAPTLRTLWHLIMTGQLWGIAGPSLYRIAMGLFWAIVIGVPIGISVGLKPPIREMTHVPFQFLRMISPLSWMPVAVLVFPSWNGAIIFLITMAAVWPVLFSTAQGVRRIDPVWFKVARNLGGRGFHLLRRIVIPAIAQDIFSGIRLALGVAWIVLVPAEYLGVTSGLGYAINDARDEFDYSTVTAIVLVIGAIGFCLDAICVAMIRQFSWHSED